MEIAGQFDEAAALAHVNYLAAPALAGRPAGRPGEAAAARYIAEQFAALGLLPAGDPEGTSFFQPFPLTRTEMLAPPQMNLFTPDGEPLLALTFRDDFNALQFGPDGTSGRGELVWVENPEEQAEEVAGALIIRRSDLPLESELAWAEASGARGLILVTTKREPEEVYAKQPLHGDHSGSLPVFELTRAGFIHLQEAMGLSPSQLSLSLPPGPLGIAAELYGQLGKPKAAESANVLGMLPGANPELREEVLILGAHYDHVGDDPSALVCAATRCSRIGGLRYPGANDDASGIGVLLEIARLWQESGYRPQRSVLFAAWGAQELDEAGSRAFLALPVVPQADITGMVQLDGVGGGAGFNLGAEGETGQDSLLIHSLDSVAQQLDEKVVLTGKRAESDHLPFQAAGVPSLLVHWRLASEANLPAGMANAVHPDRLGTTGRLVALLMMVLAQ